MMRLPNFSYYAPGTLQEAANILADQGPSATLLAGGTDLLPKMKRGQQEPGTLVALNNIRELKTSETGTSLRLGAGVTLSDLVADGEIQKHHLALWQAASQVATPQLRNAATLGGNLCVDTRCTYHDQSFDWRKAIGFCIKQDGETCWASPTSDRCWAVSSTDSAPALAALGAEVRLVSSAGERLIALDELYRDDGAVYLTRRADEILAEVILPSTGEWRSTYWKLRRRGAVDFPILSVAAAVRTDAGGTVHEVRLVLGAIASRPVFCTDAETHLIGNRMSDELIEEAASLAGALARPKENTDAPAYWRRRLAVPMVTWALKELRGDDMSAERRRLAGQSMNTSQT
jgi:4-hydroxybenzoyl-CoA reductase subunit beta